MSNSQSGEARRREQQRAACFSSWLLPAPPGSALSDPRASVVQGVGPEGMRGPGARVCFDFGRRKHRLGFGVRSEEILKVKQGAEHLPRGCQQTPLPRGAAGMLPLDSGCSANGCGSLLTISIRFTPTQLLAFLQGLFTFYHHGYELAKDFSDFKTELTISIQNVSVPCAHATHPSP